MYPANKTTPVMTPVIIKNDKLEHDGQAGYVVEPPKTDEDTIGVKLDIDNEIYQFAQGDVLVLA